MPSKANRIDMCLEPPLWDSASRDCIKVIVANTANNKKINELKKITSILIKSQSKRYIYFTLLKGMLQHKNLSN